MLAWFGFPSGYTFVEKSTGEIWMLFAVYGRHEIETPSRVNRWASRWVSSFWIEARATYPETVKMPQF